MTRRAKIKSLAWSLGLTVLLFAAMAWLLARGYGNELIRIYVEDELARRLEVPCRIEAVRGNPFGRYHVTGLELGTLASVDSLFVRYRMWNILRGRAVVDSLGVSGMRLVFDPEKETEGPPWWRSEPPLSFEVAHLELAGGAVTLAPESPDIKDISFEGGVSARKTGYRLEVHRYGSTQLHPPLTISNLSGLAVLANGDFSLENLVLETPASRVYLNGTVCLVEAPDVALTFRADSLALWELASFGELEWPDRRLALAGSLHGGPENYTCDIWASDGPSRMEGSLRRQEGLFSWVFRLDLAGYEPAAWGRPLPYPLRFDLAGTTTGSADTSGVKRADFSGHFYRMNYGDARLDSLGIDVEYVDRRLMARLAGRGPIGGLRVEVDGRLADADFLGNGRILLDRFNPSAVPQAPDILGPLSGDIQIARNEAWEVDARFDQITVADEAFSDVVLAGRFGGSRLDLERVWVGVPSVQGGVGGQFQVDFSGEAPQAQGTLYGQISMEALLKSELYGQTLDFHGHLEAQGNAVEHLKAKLELEGRLGGFRGGMDSVRVSLQMAGEDSVGIAGTWFGRAGQMRMDGRVLEKGFLDLSYLVQVIHPQMIMGVFDLPLNGSSLDLSGNVAGIWPRPAFSFEGRSDSLVVAEVPLSDVSLRGHWGFPDTGSVAIQAGKMAWGGRTLEGLFLDADHQGVRTAFVLGSSEKAQDRLFCRGVVDRTDEGFRMVLDSLHLQADQVALFNENPAHLDFSSVAGMQIDRFVLSGPAGRIEARDHPDFQETFEILVSDLDLRPWTFLLGFSGVEGVLNGELALSGALSDPLVFAEFQLRDCSFQGVRFSEASGNLSYGQGRAQTQVRVRAADDSRVELAGHFPVGGTDPRSQDFILTARSTGFEVAMLEPFFHGLGNISGVLSLDLVVSGTYEQPQLSGTVTAENGRVFLRDLNQAFDRISGKVMIAEGRAEIGPFSVGGPNDGARFGGHIDLDGLDVTGWMIDFRARGFRPVAWPELKASIDGEILFSGSPASPRISGSLVLRQADIRLLDLLEMPGIDWEEMAFYRALNMQMRVSADRQVWIRDPDIQVELTGDLDLIKDAQGLRLYGVLTSRRGFYTFQNRRLRIVHGEIQFQGREEIDPSLDIRTETDQRLPGEDRPVRIFVNVGGTLTYPEVTLSSDPGYSEADILAILVTGRSTRQVGELLGFGTEAGAGGPGVEDQALSLMLAMATRPLAKRLGDDFNLDLVEVDLSGATISRIRVGKYFGPRLFLTFAQDLTNTGREVGVELEMMRNVILEARQTEEVTGETQNLRTRSSVGVFWKREW